MRTIGTLICAVLLIGGTHLAMDRAPEAVITIEAWSPQDIHDLGWTTSPSTGLDVVGVGELVYLLGEEASGEDVFLYSWSILSQPAGSAALIPGLFDARVLFTPDLPGQYSLQLNISTGSGTSIASVGITAAEYVGVGNIGGATPSFATGQCAACHSTQATDWAETGHSDMFSLAIDGIKSSYYGEGCISCHTVGFNEDVLADNGGFDDVAEDHGWAFPATLADGNWADIVANYPELAQVSNIQCENCHGPGSEHKGDITGIDLTLDAGVCARCHAEETHHVYPMQWANSAHATGSSFARGTSNSCAPCHSGWGFVARMDPASDLSQKTGNQPITCATCHDPHMTDTEGDHQLRAAALEDVELGNGEMITFGGNGKLCMSCHKSRRDAPEYVTHNVSSHFGPHGSPQADMLAGKNAINFGFTLPNSTHMDIIEDACVTCHMSAEPGVGDPHKVGEHSFEMSADGVENVAICQTCHDPAMTSFDDLMARRDHDGDGDTEGTVDELHGLLDAVGMFLPPFGEPEVDISTSTIRAPYSDSPILKKALYNYKFVEEDGSSGVHNYQFSVALLQLTIDVLQYGVLTEGTITEVADVPNDQGKQVAVTWTRFGGDGPSDNPVEEYSIWRQGGGAAAKTSYHSIGEVPFTTDGSVAGISASFAGSSWTQVGSTPAAMMDSYTAIVPTLFDAADATFMVTGHTATSTIFAATLPATGQSIDNLVPSAPTGFVAIGSDTAVMLNWEESVDADFDYFELYKSTVEGFDPTGMDPIAALTETQYIDQAVTTGETYFYVLTAYDFSGNLGVFTPVIEAKAVAVELLGDVPTEFTLSQNYPNPFNPTTTIEFAIPEPGDVTIKIYDVSGKQVGILVNEYMQPGTYNATWDAQNLASGVYIYKMVSGSFVRTSTMLLIK